jgi:hypothetical protein
VSAESLPYIFSHSVTTRSTYARTSSGAMPSPTMTPMWAARFEHAVWSATSLAFSMFSRSNQS